MRGLRLLLPRELQRHLRRAALQGLLLASPLQAQQPFRRAGCGGGRPLRRARAAVGRCTRLLLRRKFSIREGRCDGICSRLPQQHHWRPLHAALQELSWSRRRGACANPCLQLRGATVHCVAVHPCMQQSEDVSTVVRGAIRAAATHISSHMHAPAQLLLTVQQAELGAQRSLEAQHQVIREPQSRLLHAAQTEAETGGAVCRACHHATCRR